MRIGIIALICLSFGVAYASLGVQTSLENNVLTIQRVQISSWALPSSPRKVIVSTGGIQLKLPTTNGVLKRDPVNGYVVEQLLSGTEISTITNIQLATGAITSGDIATGTLTNSSFATGSITCSNLNITGFNCNGLQAPNTSCPAGQYAYGLSNTGALLCWPITGWTWYIPPCASWQMLLYSGATSQWYCAGLNNSWTSLWEQAGIFVDKIRNKNYATWNVGVGLTGPIATLHVRDTFRVEQTGGVNYSGAVMATGSCLTTWSLATANSGYIFYVTGAKVGILTKTPQYTLDVVGQIRAVSVVTLSDARLKTNITLIDSPLAKLSGIYGYHYTLNIDGSQQYGLIAQQVEKEFPSAVVTDQNGMKSVDYLGLIAPMIEWIRELDQKTQKLQSLTQENNARLKQLLAK